MKEVRNGWHLIGNWNVKSWSIAKPKDKNGDPIQTEIQTVFLFSCSGSVVAKFFALCKSVLNRYKIYFLPNSGLWYY